MRIMITGASGFIGSCLARVLVAQSHEVSLLCRPGSSLDLIEDLLNRVQIYQAVCEMEPIKRAFEAAAPEVLVHLASCFIAEHKPEDIPQLISSNVLFGNLLLEAMISCGCKHLVNAGTAWQFYHRPSYHPVCLYAASKQAFEAVVDFYVSAYDLRAVSLYIYDTYGPNDPRRKLFRLLLDLNAGRTPSIDMSPGEQELSCLYIDDVTRAFVRAIHLITEDQKSSEHLHYALPAKESLSLKDLAATFSRVSGKSLPIAWGRRSYRKREVMKIWREGSQSLPGWSPQVSLEEGIRKVILADGQELFGS